MDIYDVVDKKTEPDIYHQYVLNNSFTSSTPLVIDNGSYHCKVGWATDDKPRLLFKNVMAKLRGKKESDVQIGNDIPNLEVVRWLLKTQFDKNIVTHFDAQEQIFDYMFSHLGISTAGKVDHPILLSEAPCNPNYSRQLMTELMFECYNIPKLAFGIDGLFSFQLNQPKVTDGLVISCGYQTTHILPVLDNKLCTNHCRRVNIGGCQTTSFMHRLMQLKYPVHAAAVTLTRAEDWIAKHCRIATHYHDDLQLWTDVDYYCNYVRKLQLPFNAAVQSVASAEAQKERKLQQVKRLQEMNAKRREESLVADEGHLIELQNIQLMIEDSDEFTKAEILRNHGFDSTTEFESTMNKIAARIDRTKAKMNAAQNVTIQEPKAKKVCLESEIAQFGSIHAYVNDIWQRREVLLEARTRRRQRRSDMAKRRTLASQQRMKIISQLAADKKKEDDFGVNDDDWQVYKVINKEAGDTDSEEEQEKLNEFEQVLLEHDPDFKKDVEIEGYDANSAEFYQLHLDTEQIRVPELLFQPSMMGFEQCGISEVIDFTLKRFSSDEQNRLVKNVFLTGGPALIPGFKKRLEKDLLEIRPFQSSFSVKLAANPEYDGWNGARQWANNSSNFTYFMTKDEYEEYGDGYLKVHSASNNYFSTPKVKLSTSAAQNKEARNVVTPVIPAKRQVVPRNKNQRILQLRKGAS